MRASIGSPRAAAASAGWSGSFSFASRPARSSSSSLSSHAGAYEPSGFSSAGLGAVSERLPSEV